MFLVLFLNQSFSQTPVENVLDLEQRKQRLEQFAIDSEDHYTKNLLEALRLAPQKGWLVWDETDDGQIISLQGIDQAGFPIYYTTHNLDAAATIGTNKLWPGGSSGFDLSGSGEEMSGKIGIWDGGRVMATHQEYAGRILQVDSPSSVSSHATHVAGTMIAAGVNPLARGMSFEAEQLRAWDFSNDVSEMAGAAAGLLVSNHSYGAIAGWRYNSSNSGTATDPNWEFWGDPNISTYEDYKFGYYSQKASDWDNIAYLAPYYLIVKSAGNNRNSNGPAIGSPYWQRTSAGSWQLVSAREEGAIYDNDAYDILSSYANAKNILVVGAVESIPEGYSAPDDVVMSSFSSWGPTDDGRIKPDVVANGVGLLSAGSNNNSHYRTASGTSMAAPNASGSLFLLQELFHRNHNSFMLSSTLKGIIAHTADEAGNTGPDYVYGWGLINMEKAAETVNNTDGKHWIEEIPLFDGDTLIREFVAGPEGPMIITMSWTDPKGIPLPYGPDMLNNRTPILVNDLDIRAQHNTLIYKPWVLDVENPALPAATGDNQVDNIEQILIDDPVPGRTYTVSITHKESLLDSVQVFSLIASGVDGTAICPSYAESESGARIDGFYLNTLQNNTASGCHSYRDFTHLQTTLKLGSTYPFTISAGTCDDENDRIIKLFVDWQADGIFDESDLVATSGLISVTTDFEGMIEVPPTVVPGTKARLRIVLVETDQPEAVMPCGSYPNGETQDYLLHFAAADYDLSIDAITYPSGDTICATDQEGVETRIKNNGTAVMESFLLTASIYENGSLIQTLEEFVSDSILPNNTRIVQFSESFSTGIGKNYSIQCSVFAENDQNPTNDTLSLSFVTAPNAEIYAASAGQCRDTDHIVLQADADGIPFWYSAAENGNLIAVGQNTTAQAVLDELKVFLGVNTLRTSIGPTTKDTPPWTGGAYHQATISPLITTHVPLIIKSATLYAGWPGDITFWIEDAETDEVVSQTTISVQATRNPPSQEIGAGNDPDDTGQEYFLNLEIPEAGDYRIHVHYEGGATLFRNNASDDNPYPYTVPDVMSITGTSSSASTAFYCWLYDIKLESLECQSELVEVDVVIYDNPAISITSHINADSTVTLDAGYHENSGYAWNTGDETQTITVDTPGMYTVTVTNQWGCYAQDSIMVEILGTEAFFANDINIYPNPTHDRLFIEAEKTVHFAIYTLDGMQLIRSQYPANIHHIDTSQLGATVYLIKIEDALSGLQRYFKLIKY